MCDSGAKLFTCLGILYCVINFILFVSAGSLNLFTIAPYRLVRDVYPVRLFVIPELPDHLVPHQVVFHEVEDVCIRDATEHVGIRSSASPTMCCEYLLPDCFVQLLPSISRAHGDRYTEVIADGLEYILCYSLEVFDLPVFGCVIDPKAAGRV